MKIKSSVFILDSTLISLCLGNFEWTKYRKRKGAEMKIISEIAVFRVGLLFCIFFVA
jgi:hypothetical protein